MKKKSTKVLLVIVFLFSGISEIYSANTESGHMPFDIKNSDEVNDPFDLSAALSISDSNSLFRSLGVGIFCGPNLSGRYLKFNEPPEENQIRYEYMNALNDRESSKYNYSGGLFARLECNNYIAFRTGINFNRVSYKSSQLDSILIGSDPNNGPIYSSGVYTFQYDICSVPLELLINFLPKNKIARPYFGVGILSGFAREKFLVNNNVPHGYPFLQYPTTTNPNADVNCIAGLAVNVNRFVGFVELNYRYGLTQKSAPYPISKVLFSFNLNVGFGFKLYN